MLLLTKKALFLAYNPLFFALFSQIQSIIIFQKQGFAKYYVIAEIFLLYADFFSSLSPFSYHQKNKKPLFSSSPHTPITSSIDNTLFKIPREKGEGSLVLGGIEDGLRRRGWVSFGDGMVGWEEKEKKRTLKV